MIKMLNDKIENVKNALVDKVLLDLEHGDIDVAYNKALGIHVLVMGDGLDYLFRITNKDGIVLKEGEVGFTSKVGYYSANDIAFQSSTLPDYLLINKD